MTDNFKDNIKSWVLLDNEYKELNEKIRRVRERKHILLDGINTHVTNNNLNNATVKISDGKLKFSTIKITKPLTLKYIEECLKKHMSDENATDLLNYIKENRLTSYSDDIKRYYE
jgi:hypothetical protein